MTQRRFAWLVVLFTVGGLTSTMSTAHAAQVARPDRDVSNSGNWSEGVSTADSDTSLWNEITDTDGPDDSSTYDKTADMNEGGANKSFVVSLSSVGDPHSSVGHVILLRARKNQSGGINISLDVALERSDGTVLASFTTPPLDEVWTDYTYALTDSEANSITSADYGDLQVNVAADPSAGPSTNGRHPEITKVQLQLPEAPVIPPQCSDGLDNDLDGKVDYPADAECIDPNDTTESLLSVLQPGDRLEDAGGVAVIVPDPGVTVAAEAYLEDGTTELLEVETTLEGVVIVREWGSEAEAATEPGSSSSVAPDECNDGYYDVADARWFQTLYWRFKNGSNPSNVSEANAIDKLREATRNITNVNNICRISDNVGATASYEGVTSNGPNIQTNSTCTKPDSRNVVSFGDLEARHLGYACWWSGGGAGFYDTDFKLNKVEHGWYAFEHDGCTTRYSIEAVSTHERGHTFGLRHGKGFTELQHGELTMSHRLEGPCQKSESTLGLGDIRGLQQRY